MAMTKKTRCSLEFNWCERHEIYHGYEAKSLRNGLEELIAKSERFYTGDHSRTPVGDFADHIKTLRQDLHYLLDSVDAGDCLAATEDSEG